MGNRAFKIIITILAAGGIVFAYLYMSQEPEKKVIHIGDVELQVEVADTIPLRARGLSDRENLDENSGMLFIYSKPDIRKFWMKDMHFALDVLWISDNVVVGFQENVPFEQDNVDVVRFASELPAEWALEVNAGWITKHGIKIGDTVDINND